MANINFNAPDNKIQRIVKAMKGLYPIPFTDDEPPVPLFTDGQWAKEAVRRLVVRDVRRWEQKLATEAARIQEDDELLT